jgi:hypothetical protein
MSNNINPNAENCQSQVSMILDYMLRGNKITGEDARKLFSCSRLPARIADIEKKLGYAPKRERIWVKNQFGKKIQVMAYWI